MLLRHLLLTFLRRSFNPKAMNKPVKSQVLLPKGFEDLLPPDADAEFFAINVLMQSFEAFGYQRVKPPMAEFEESLLGAGPGKALADQAFRVMDPQSEKMLALRSDITAQIARIATSRLASEPRPLRLTYANDVIRTRASQQRTLRQFCQVGCELVGGDEKNSVVEMAVVALKGLSRVGLENVTIDFSLPDIVDAVFEAASVDKAEIDSLRAKLAGTADGAIERLEGLALSGDAAEQVAHLKEVVTEIKDAVEKLGISGVSYTVDPLETRGFEYHRGVTFTLFSADAHGEIGRGGCYCLLNGNSTADDYAAGFTLYMDTVRSAIPDGEGYTRVFVPADAGWDVLDQLQGAGYVTVRGFDGGEDALSTCTHIYKNGKVEPI